MYEHRSTRSVKISMGHLYPGLSGATVPRCGAKLPRLIMRDWLDLGKFLGKFAAV